jgi:hypothetical protein
MRRALRVVVGGALILVHAHILHAQIVSPTIERRAIELGLAYKWFDRDVQSGPVSELQWEVATLYGRYGAFDRVTFSAEGGVWDVDHPDFPLGYYRRYTMGGGIAVRAFERGAVEVAIAGHYQTVWDNDQTSWDFDKRTRGWNADVLLARRFTPHGQYLRAWAGPAYVNDRAENFLWGASDPVVHEPESHWGVVAGGEMVLWDRVSGLAYVLFLDHPQGRIGLAWRMGGGE